MKKTTILLCVLALATISATAQKKSWYMGGNAGFSSSQTKHNNGTTTVDGSKNTNWTFSPEVGTFITNNIQIGVGITMAGNKSDNQSTPININKSTSYGGTLYSRYFFGKEAFKPFVGLNVSALSGGSKTTIGSVTSDGPDNFTFGTNINAGFGYAISKRFTTVGSFGFLGYTKYTQKQGNAKYTSTSFGLDAQSLGNRFNVGFYYTL
jgi:Outer membrane protein beta-barrel domain